jgi:polysaccharide biosynthesis/export protein
VTGLNILNCAAALAAAVALSGCASLPSSGPTARDLVASAAGAPSPYRIVDLDTPSAVGLVDAPQHPSLLALDTAEAATRPDELFAGDVLDITVFEIGAALFGGGRASGEASPGGPPVATGQQFAGVRVGEDGGVSLPYLGRLQAAGRTPAELQADIQAALRGRSQSPQVVVTVREDVGDTVMILGDVKTPGRRPLTAAHERILDAVALAGGPAQPKFDSVVRLTRAGRFAELALNRLTADAAENLLLRPQDRVEIINRPRTFTAFGASGKVSEVPFQAEDLSLAEAVAKIGGPLDQQADPTAVFVFRAGAGAPVIYRLDLNRAEGYFAAQRFLMQDKDLIYVANARSNAWAKFLAMVSFATNPVVTGRQLAR